MSYSNPEPSVVVYDPLTWDHDWSYELERAELSEHGIRFLVPGDEQERDRMVQTADVVIASGLVPLTEQVITSFSKCVGVVCYSSGMDAVDLGASQAAGISVRNINASTTEVADHAMALVLAAHRLIVQMAIAAARDEWDLRRFPEISEIRRLTGQVLGIVGAGRIGRAVAHRARAFGFETIATYHHRPDRPPVGLPHFDLKDLFRRADTIVLCAALTEDSRSMINGEVLSVTKPGAVLVNVARGGLIDEQALLQALDDGVIRIAALDVRDPEPPRVGDRLSRHPRVIQTPHIGGASRDAFDDLHHLAAQTVIELLIDTGRLPRP